ncbi:hypothetical protein Tco_1206590 [Tanacetum coccineum]
MDPAIVMCKNSSHGEDGEKIMELGTMDMDWSAMEKMDNGDDGREGDEGTRLKIKVYILTKIKFSLVLFNCVCLHIHPIGINVENDDASPHPIDVAPEPFGVENDDVASHIILISSDDEDDAAPHIIEADEKAEIPAFLDTQVTVKSRKRVFALIDESDSDEEYWSNAFLF